MKKVTAALKKYKHVNKKAFEQYTNFTNEQDRLLKRRKDLDDSEDSIRELVSHLDRCKDEAIERTFKQVSREFATIFEKLVPAGCGRLVIQRRADRSDLQDDESEDEDRGAVENYTGVGISVSFNSTVMDEQQKIQQLSGGQKSKLPFSPSRFPFPASAFFIGFPKLLPCPGQALPFPCHCALTCDTTRLVRPLPHLCPPGDRVLPHGHL